MGGKGGWRQRRCEEEERCWGGWAGLMCGGRGWGTGGESLAGWYGQGQNEIGATRKVGGGIIEGK